MSVSAKRSVKREREKRERKGLELQFFPIATEKDDDKKIRMCTCKNLQSYANISFV